MVHCDAYEMSANSITGSPNTRVPLPNTYVNYSSRRLSRNFYRQQSSPLHRSPPYSEKEKDIEIGVGNPDLHPFEKDMVIVEEVGGSPDTKDGSTSDGASTIKDV